METQVKRFWLIAITVMLLGFTSWHDQPRPRDVNVLQQTIDLYDLPNGALIFRRGRGVEAHVVLTAQPAGARWSHVGLISVGSNGVTVIHAAPAEAEDQPGMVKEEPLATYLAEEHAVNAEVMIVNGASPEDAEAVIHAARRMIGTPFGVHPDNKDSREIYCTQLVLSAWESVGITLTRQRDRIQIPFIEGLYLMPDTLASSSLLIQALRRAN